MKKRFVCLANSYKEKGRCVAGIELDDKGKIITKNGRPKWIRPVSKAGHGEIPSDSVSEMNILDIVEMDVLNECPDRYQTENVYFNDNSFQLKGTFPKKELSSCCEEMKYLFGTSYASLSEEVIEKTSHSLVLIKVETFEIIQNKDENNPSHIKLRIKFNYRGVEYDLPITDPVFSTQFQNNAKILDNKNEIILCVSLGVKFDKTGRYYKLVAGIIH